MQETRVQCLVWDDPTYHRATKPVNQNYWAYALEPRTATTKAYVLYREATTVETRIVTRAAPALCNYKPCIATEDPEKPKINKI